MLQGALEADVEVLDGNNWAIVFDVVRELTDVSVVGRLTLVCAFSVSLCNISARSPDEVRFP